MIPKIQNTKETQSSTTTFLFALKEKSYVNMLAFDLENTFYDSIVGRELVPGNYQVMWQNSEQIKYIK